MNQLLDNPVYYALISGDSQKALGNENVKYFESAVSPFVGIRDNYTSGFEELHDLLPDDRNILYASREKLNGHAGWELNRLIEGSQFLYLSRRAFEEDFSAILPLTPIHSAQMVELARLTKPGPFDLRTIEFGNYEGIFEGDKIVSMAGRRLHVFGYIEVSAVCTHPHSLGKGYATLLLKHQVNTILEEGKVPFLHVRSDNYRAIELYERLGFVRNGNMNFYVMSKLKEEQ